MKELKDYVRSIKDFPEPGIIFRDVTSVLQDAEGLKLAIDSMIQLLDGVEFDVIAGAESRGFILGAPIVKHSLITVFIWLRMMAACRAGRCLTACVRRSRAA